MKIWLIGYYGAGNLGDELLLRSCLNILRSLAGEASDAPDICIFEHSQKWNLHVALRALHSNQVVIFGGGSIFQDDSSLRSILYYACLAMLSKFLGKKLLLLGQGIGPLKSHLGIILTRFVYRAADFVDLRDRVSYRLARRWRHHSPSADRSGEDTHRGLDLVCYLPNINAKPHTNTDGASVAISLRPCKGWVSSHRGALLGHIKRHHAVESICAWHLQTIDERETSIMRSLLAADPLRHDWKIWSTSPQALMNEGLPSTKMIYAMRFHALLLAWRAGIPCIGLIYDPKVREFCREWNIPSVELNDDFAQNLELAHEKLSIQVNSDSSESYVSLDESMRLVKMNELKGHLNRHLNWQIN